MTVRRIVANIATDEIAPVRAFDAEVFGLATLMDPGWIVALGAPQMQAVQLGIATEGGSGTAVPALSIEVDDLDATFVRAQAAGPPSAYGPAVEPWGVRRFYLRDPAGRLVNVPAHTG
ncbi:MAG: glyoxalase [Amaricoccus sp.]|uniref:VOC family protein n=1 Tax=Amaricoccus sp. TaxID=1872485 RepID=UPI0039E45C25